ncbi:MAG: hypothetical protein ABIN01_17275 [Ferruginibacter sp.]
MERRANFKRVILPTSIILLVMAGYFILSKEKHMQTSSSIKGIIQNKAGRPVADAIVMIKEGSHEFNDIASVSNEKGEFFVSGIVIPGRYVLQIQQDSNTVTKEINIQSADTIIRVNI